MRRREFIALAGAAVTWQGAARAQNLSKQPTIGMFTVGTTIPAPWKVFWLALKELGWSEGHNFKLEARLVPSSDGLAAAAAELVALNVDVIVAASSIQVEATRKATNAIPIVFAYHADPVGVGHVETLARPGGNATGLAMLLTDLVSKQLEILKETVPRMRRVTILWSPSTPSHRHALQAIEVAAEKLGLAAHLVRAQSADEFDAALASMDDEKADAFLDVASAVSFAQREQFVKSAIKFARPGMFGYRQSVEIGGLMSYGPDVNNLWHRAAAYVDKILKGAKPSELPVEQATRFQLVINLKTAKALALRMPPSLLARADELIE